MSRSASIQDDIIGVSAKLKEIHAEVHRTSLRRHLDTTSRLEWEAACKAFHSFESTLDPYIERACNDERYDDSDLLEFVVCFLEVDPWVFRSGYLKQVFLTRLKRSRLDSVTRRRLLSVLLDAVERRGGREFRYYCRLAAAIADQGTVDALAITLAKTNGAKANRAKLMLEAIRQSGKLRGNVA
jgi:hypothetical protein